MFQPLMVVRVYPDGGVQAEPVEIGAQCLSDRGVSRGIAFAALASRC